MIIFNLASEMLTDFRFWNADFGFKVFCLFYYQLETITYSNSGCDGFFPIAKKGPGGITNIEKL
jgi:hypothetical protein